MEMVDLHASARASHYGSPPVRHFVCFVAVVVTGWPLWLKALCIFWCLLVDDISMGGEVS